MKVIHLFKFCTVMVYIKDSMMRQNPLLKTYSSMGGLQSETFIDEYADGKHTLIVLDELMNAALNSELVERLFVQSCHHKGLWCILHKICTNQVNEPEQLTLMLPISVFNTISMINFKSTAWVSKCIHVKQLCSWKHTRTVQRKSMVIYLLACHHTVAMNTVSEPKYFLGKTQLFTYQSNK